MVLSLCLTRKSMGRGLVLNSIYCPQIVCVKKKKKKLVGSKTLYSYTTPAKQRNMGRKCKIMNALTTLATVK